MRRNFDPDHLRQRSNSIDVFSPVQAIMTGLFGLSVAVTLGLAVAGLADIFRF